MIAPTTTGGAADFDYLPGAPGRVPSLTLEPQAAPVGRVTTHVEVAAAIVLDLPADPEGLRKLRRGGFWKSLRRRRRRAEEQLGALRFSWVDEPAAVAAALPEVRELFCRRWEDTHTSLPWHSERGFAPYADALLQRCGDGRGALALLRDERGGLLAFTWLLLDAPWAYAWQHAARRDGELAPLGLGTLLDVWTLEHLIARGDIEHFDFMVGDSDAKRGWESWRRPVYRRLDAPDTPAGRASLRVRAAALRALLWLRDRHPETYERGKVAICRLERLLPASD